MAVTRKFLKALGIEDEKIDEIIEAHTEVTEALKKERDSYKADAEEVGELRKKVKDAEDDVTQMRKRICRKRFIKDILVITYRNIFCKTCDSFWCDDRGRNFNDECV